MDIFENRRRWLAHWIDKDFGGDRKKAETATGYTRSQLSQYLSANYQEGRSPQERAARSLETKFGKPPRIMETPAPGTPEANALVNQGSAGESAELPQYVSDAITAVRAAHAANAPRELFDSVRVIFALLQKSEGASTAAPQKDETVAAPAAMPSIEAQADAAQKEAENRLATRSGEKRGARKTGERKVKNLRH